MVNTPDSRDKNLFADWTTEQWEAVAGKTLIIGHEVGTSREELLGTVDVEADYNRADYPERYDVIELFSVPRKGSLTLS